MQILSSLIAGNLFSALGELLFAEHILINHCYGWADNRHKYTAN